MWVILALCSAAGLGIYDVMKKLSVRDNNVLTVLMLNTLFGMLFMLPFIVEGAINGNFGFGNSPAGHGLILIKSLIVLGSWTLGYYAIKHLPLTIQGPINASRPVMVLIGAVLIFGERLNLIQWCGIIMGMASLLLISQIGRKEVGRSGGGRWVIMSVGAAVLGAISGLYDKHLLRHFDPIEVQSWYSLYQFLIMTATILIIKCRSHSEGTPFRWRWTIPLISLFLTLADMAYFYALSFPGSMIAIVSMIRRGSVIIPFLFGILVLHERGAGRKALDLAILIGSLILLVIGSR